MALGMARKAARTAAPSKARTLLARAAAALIALYGVVTFGRNGLLSYMLLENQFIFFDLEQSALFFFSDYLAMIGFWIFAAHYAGKLARLPVRRRGPQGQDSIKEAKNCHPHQWRR